MRIIPLIRLIGTDTFFSSFILNSLCLAITSTVAVEMKGFLNEKKGYIYTYLNSIIPGKDLSEGQKLIITFVTASFPHFWYIIYFIYYLDLVLECLVHRQINSRIIHILSRMINIILYDNKLFLLS